MLLQSLDSESDYSESEPVFPLGVPTTDEYILDSFDMTSIYIPRAFRESPERVVDRVGCDEYT